MAIGLRTQHQHLIRLHTVLGKDALFVTHVNGSLAMSSIDHFDLDVYSDTLHNIQPADIIGTLSTITLHDENGEPLFYSGYVTSFRKSSPALAGQSTQYTIELKPWLHFLAHDSDCRIFQNATVEDVLNTLLKPYETLGKYTLSLPKNYPQKRYQVQYNETNLDFFNRICHYSGLAYYFTYDEGDHHLHVIDSGLPLASLSPSVIRYQPGTHARDHLTTWERNSHYGTGNVEQRSYNYKLPSHLLVENRAATGDIAEVPRVSNATHYRYIEDFDSQGDISEHSTTRITQITSGKHSVSAGGDCRYLKIARTFSVQPVPITSFFPDKDKLFTLVSLSIYAHNDGLFQTTLVVTFPLD